MQSLTDGFEVSLVIPAWNEQATIRQAIQEARTALRAVAADYEILVIDDGSTDDTAEIVRAEAAGDPHLKLINHEQNRGYGAALRSGFQAARFELVAFTDADCQFDLDELTYMLPLTQQYDVVSGYRINRQDTSARLFFSWGYNTLVKLLIGSPIHDIDCALKVFHRAQLQDMLPQSENYFANTEMLTRACRQGRSVVEVGVHHRPRAAGSSKVSLLDVPRTLVQLLPFWWSRALFPATAPTGNSFGLAGWCSLLLVALIAGLLLFTKLSYPLLEPDEGRYAEIGREMLRCGNWIVPTLNHEPYYDKPPLVYWLTAGSLRLFGLHPWAARLVPALAAYLTIFATMFFGSRAAGIRAGLLASTALTLSIGFIQCGRMLILDSVLGLFVALALFTAFEAVQGSSLRRAWWLASAVCCALGVLTKGPVALVLVVPPLVAYLGLQSDKTRPSIRQWIGYAGLVIGLVLPWYAAIIVCDPAFAYQFFVAHHLYRFFGSAYHARPVWFYVPVLFIGGLPWSLLVLPFGRFLFSRSDAVRACRPQSMGFFLLWAAWCVLFFSLSHGKLPSYVLPAAPALAMLLGGYLEPVLFASADDRLFQSVRAAMPRVLTVTLAIAALACAGWAWWRELLHPRQQAMFIVLALGIGCILAVLAWSERLTARAAWLLCGACAFAVLLWWTHDLIPAFAADRSPLARKAAIRNLTREGDTGVVCVGVQWGSVPFYFDDDEHFLDSKDQSWEAVEQFLCRHPRSLVLMHTDFDWATVRFLTPAGMAMSKLMNSGKAQVLLVEPRAGKQLDGLQANELIRHDQEPITIDAAPRRDW